MSIPRCLRGASAAGAVVVGLLLSAPAQAADGVDIDYVETADDGTVSVLLGVDRLPNGAVPDLDGLAVTVDGGRVEATARTIEGGEIQRTTVLTMDTSLSMEGGPIEDAKVAAKAFLAAAPLDVQVGLVTFSGEVQEVISPTTDHEALAATLDDITLTKGTRVYDAVVESVRLAGDEGARSVLLLTDGQDQGGGALLEDAVAAAADNDVVLDVVALDQTPKSQALLAQIADASGGSVIPADPASLESVLTAQADALAEQVLVLFPRPEDAAGEVNLEVSLTTDGATYADSAFVPLAGVLSEGPAAVDLGEPLVSRSVMLFGAAALGLGLAGVLSVVLMGSRGPSQSQQLVAAYLGETKSNRGKGAGESPQTSLRETAVALTSNLVKGDFETRLSDRLNGAGMSLTAAEWLLLHAGIAAAGGLVGLLLGGGASMMLLIVVGAVVPWFYLRRKHAKRLTAFNAQLAETLGLMAGGLSAGLSLPQAVDTVVREGNEPMASELRRVLVEQRLGVDIEDALDGVAMRMKSEDFGWVVMAIRIQREVGGNLAELLNTVAETLREREFLRRQVRVLSAEGRLSAWVLGALPIAMFLYMFFVRRDVIRILYTDPRGLILSAAAIVMLALGGFTLSRIVKVEV